MTELNPFTLVGSAVVELLTRHGDMFVSTGTNMFRGFAIILIAWFGIRAALASTEGHGVPFGRFASLLLTIAIGFTMITFYDRPIPGIGRSFTHLVTDQAQALAANARRLAAVKAVADELGYTPAQIALAWVLRSGVIPIPGTRHVAHLEGNWAANDIALEPAQIAELEDAFQIGATAGERYPPGAPAVPGRSRVTAG